MTVKELRKWLFERAAEDSWWVSINGQVQESAFTLDEVQAKHRLQPSIEVRLLHTSMADLEHPPWVDFEAESVRAMKIKARAKTLKPAAKTGPKPISTLIRKQHTASHKRQQTIIQPDKKRVPVELISGIALAVALVVTLMWWGLSSKNASDASEQLATSREAYYETKKFVMPYLQGDGTVSIPSDSSPQVSHTSLGDGRFRVKSYARVLKPDNTKEMVSYNATVKYSSNSNGSGSWLLEHLQIGNTDVVQSTASSD